MADMSFYVSALWDEDAKVFYSESNIIGLHIEAETIEEFEEVMKSLAPSLVLDNHITKKDLAQKSWAEMIPAIFFKQPAFGAASA
ncbi:DUF1902 domain-containing protein [Aliiroseovarius sp. Z3]|uniref:DUF1902 domain-containing protein n=1 Tax=Aliiroseovarius sp. Z3 TaxID=2811402 RepID=UPI0023B2FA2F|nr:DUF1902 domain-containing protein [Aliiroseovarius sp. Z3]MDE9449989.1 DUF1902 domain-containing protein [Aliiroseovarius sp. Z3]